MLKSERKLSNSQKTIKKTIFFSGIGLHSGRHCNVKINPAPTDKGIIFIRKDVGENNSIYAHWTNVTSTKLCTTISNKNNVSVGTIEHLMSALSGMHIDNVMIEIDGPEIPIMDGSAKPFVKLIEDAEVAHQSRQRTNIKVLKDVMVENNNGSARIRPNDQFSINIEIDFPCSIIDHQSCQLQMINGNYKEDVSEARTFGFEEDVENLRNSGFALGGNLSNAVVVGKDRILNKEGLRYKDEFVRHKILDSIGDLYLAGHPIHGFFEGKRSGHKLNNELLKKLLSDKTNWKLGLYS